MAFCVCGFVSQDLRVLQSINALDRYLKMSLLPFTNPNPLSSSVPQLPFHSSILFSVLLMYNVLFS